MSRPPSASTGPRVRSGPAWCGQLAALALLLMVTVASTAGAMMCGSAPDTPAARVDANTAASPWTSAVSVVVSGSAYSGVVIAPRHVLTAAHVVGAAAPAAVSVQVNDAASPTVLAATAIERFPSASFPYDDLAVITLAHDVPPTVQVRAIYQGAPAAGTPITLVGYGSSGPGDTGPVIGSSASIKRSGRNALDAVQTTVDTSGRSSLFYLFDFDGPSGSGELGGASLGNAVETGLASGDSGSPAFIQVSGQWRLLGVNNFVAPRTGMSIADSRFGTSGGGIRLSDPRFVAWLNASTGGTLGQSSVPAGDAPLPAWAGALMALSLAAAWRRHGAQRRP